MAFDSLSEKLQNVFKNLRSKGKLTEDDVKAALKEVKMALLEADVNFKVVKQFTKSVQERAIGQDVMNGLNPGQMVIKIVNEEMIKLMGSETTEIAFRPGKELTVIMMVGLQGAGKTTTTAKIAGKLKSKGKKSLLVACDVYRPAAIEQLKINGEKQGVEVFSMGDKNKPADIAKAAVEHAKKNDFNVVIIDTAGRLHIDEDMMAELIEIKEATDVFQTILVVDAMTGQDAVNVAGTFDEKIGIDGVVITKLDGDTRGGAALEFLFINYPQKPEGELTKLRASIVCEPTLALCTKPLDLGKYLRLGRGEDHTGGRKRKSILSDALEAVIGAIYLDGGFTNAKEFVLRFIMTDIENKQLFYDSKTILQELIQGRHEQLSYELIDESGPDHDKQFTVAVLVDGERVSEGEGHTKKAAEQQAAYQALLLYRNRE